MPLHVRLTREDEDLQWFCFRAGNGGEGDGEEYGDVFHGVDFE
jgi:hypothetical protein